VKKPDADTINKSYEEVWQDDYVTYVVTSPAEPAPRHWFFNVGGGWLTLRARRRKARR
jgi:hypothetical protein